MQIFWLAGVRYFLFSAIIVWMCEVLVQKKHVTLGQVITRETECIPYFTLQLVSLFKNRHGENLDITTILQG